MLEAVNTVAYGAAMTTKAEMSVRAEGQRGARIGRSEWIGGAIQVLAREGIAGVRVEVLAARLNVTKGSFYWHFADREALYDAMLERWRSIATSAIIERVEGAGGTPRAKLQHLIAITARNAMGAQLETAMRSWARQDRRVANAIAAADRERVAYVAGLLRDLGVAPALADLRARILYLAVIGSYFSVAQRTSGGRDLWREIEALIA
jgi:AcrR family transcriptional regulator